ncbi:MAG: PAS domain S-box protein, partial [Bacteroidota bacterium]|nr:PAS domain S-box protein [Bacteroidota bacterium]
TKEFVFEENKKGIPMVSEWRSLNKDNTLTWVETQSSLILDRSCKPFLLIAICKDITARKIAEIKLQESQQRYQSLFDYNPDAIFNLDLDGKFTDVNPAALDMAQTNKENLIGASFKNIANPKDNDVYENLLKRAITGSITGYTMEIVNSRGQKSKISLTNVPIIVEGKMIGVSSIVRDITEISRLQKEKDLLYSISNHIDNEDTLKTAIDKSLKDICDFNNSVVGEIWIPASSKKSIRLQHCFSKDEIKFKRFINFSQTLTLKPGEDIQGFAWDNQQVTWHENIPEEPFFVRKDLALKAGLKSCLSAPLKFKGECMAILTLFTEGGKIADKHFISFLEIVSSHLAAEIFKRKSRDELNLFFEISTDLLCIAGLDGYYKKVNKGFSDALGHNLESFLEKPLLGFLHPEDVENTKLEVKGLEGGEPVQCFINRMKCADGTFKWFEWTAQSLPDQEVFFCIGRDISYQKSREEELQRIKLAVEGTNDAIAILDQARKPIYHNKAFIQLIGYSPEELIYIGGPAALYINRGQFEKIKKIINKGQAFEGDVQLLSRNKTVVDFNIRANIIYDAQKQDIGLLIIFTNISERLKMEKKIHYEKYFAETTINALPGIFYMLDKKGSFRRWNKNFERITQYSKKEIKQLTTVDLFHKEEQTVVGSKIKEVFEKGEAYVEASLVNKSSERIPYYFTGMLTKVDKEEFLLGFGIDITEQKTVQEQLKEAHNALALRAEELKISNEELENFAYIASHDLQEPLRMITGFLQLLQEKYKNNLDEDGVQYIHYVLDGAERMKALILDLLEYSKVGTNTTVFSEIDLNVVMEDLRNIFKEKIEEENVKIICDSLPLIKGIKIQIMQLFQNLIGNAIKYRSKEDPIIHITVEENKRSWIFSVSDNGIGIQEKYHEKVFVIFKRLHTRKEYSGTGLGLAICKKIVERQGGKIWVDSKEHEGSKFSFEIMK